jgi:hypothetical protein
MLLIPSAIPRWCTGNASVMIGAEPAEADDQHAGHDEVAEDHPQQIEGVGRLQRVELDAAEDVRHRDQGDRGVERRQEHAERRVRHAIHLYRSAFTHFDNTQVACTVSL